MEKSKRARNRRFRVEEGSDDVFEMEKFIVNIRENSENINIWKNTFYFETPEINWIFEAKR